MSDPIVEFRVYLPGKHKPRLINAVYYKIENGTVCFRVPGEGYPLCVACFAAGQWISIERDQ